MSKSHPHRIAARAIIVKDDAVLLVNAYGGGKSDLWCAPGGGAEIHASLPENLKREIFEETGLTVSVGQPCLINEFHLPERNFHQVEIFFRCDIIAGEIDPSWKDPENIVTKRRFFSQSELRSLRFKPSCLADVAFSTEKAVLYDPLELIVS